MGERLTGSAHQHLRTVSVEGAGSRFKAQGTADTLKPLAGAPHRAKRHLARRAKQAGDARAFLFSLYVPRPLRPRRLRHVPRRNARRPDFSEADSKTRW